MQIDRDNHSNQINPDDDAYWQSRGWDERPEDWEKLLAEEDQPHSRDEGKLSSPFSIGW